MIAYFLACGPSESVNNVHLSDVVQTFELVAADPTKTVELCQTMPPEHRDQCFLLGVEHLQLKHPEQVEKICPLLQTESKGECWFLLAERTNNNIFCILAHPYEKNCQLHLLSRQLFRSKSDDWDTMVNTAKQFNVDPLSKEGKTVLFRQWLSSSSHIQTSRCSDTIDDKACIMAAKSLYRDRLRYAEQQKTFPCSSEIPLNMQPMDSPELAEIFDEFESVICVD